MAGGRWHLVVVEEVGLVLPAAKSPHQVVWLKDGRLVVEGRWVVVSVSVSVSHHAPFTLLCPVSWPGAGVLSPVSLPGAGVLSPVS